MMKKVQNQTKNYFKYRKYNWKYDIIIKWKKFITTFYLPRTCNFNPESSISIYFYSELKYWNI